MQQNELIKIRNLSAWYQKNKKVLYNFNLDLYKKQVVGLIGLNGAGKTTFLNILSGINKNYLADSVIWNGHQICFRDEKFKINRYIVFAEDESFGYFTFNEYLNYVFNSYNKELNKNEVAEMVYKFNFEKYRNMLIKDLSTGNKKKVYLITRFALHTELLLLDEPVNGLDFESTEYLYQLMKGYKKYGTLLFSSHVLESICLTSDKVIVLERGLITNSFENGQIKADSIRMALQDKKGLGYEDKKVFRYKKNI